MTQNNYILWLPSWYPNEREPYSGDFIQRHARAVALFSPITVIFFTQYGEKQAVDFRVEEKIKDTLKELIVYVPFRPSNISFIDKIIYNLKFYSFAKKYLKSFFKKEGLPSLVHVHVPVKSGNLAVWVKKRYGVRYILSEQASTYLKTAPDNFYQRHWFYKRQVNRVFDKAEWVTNVSEAVGIILRKLFNIKSLSVIHNCVDTKIFHRSGSKYRLFTYIHVSTLSEQKNVEGILRVFHQLSEVRRDWQLVLVGPYTTAIKDFVEQNHLQDLIRLTGEIPYKQVSDFMQQSHVFVLFSKHENFPCVIVEALCCGLPVVTSNVAGIAEAVNASNGILVQSGNEGELLNALLEMKQKYGDYDRVLIEQRAADRYAMKVIGKQFQDLYKKILSK